MTNLARRVLTVLALLLLFILGVELLLWAVVLQTGDYNWYLRYFVVGFGSLSSVGRYALAAALILIPLFVLSLAVRAMQKPRVLQARSHDGDVVNLTEEAVRRCIQHEIKAIPEVAGLRSSARNGQKGPRVALRLWVWAGADVPSVRRRARHETARALRQLFGVGEIESVHVVVEGLVFRDRKGRKIARRPSGRRAPAVDAG